MNIRLGKIAFLVLALPAAAAAFVWARHAYRGALAQYQCALAYQPETIQKTLDRIKLPPGFKDPPLCAGARRASHGGGPQGKVIFVGTAETKVYAVTVDAASGIAGGVSEFAPTIEMNVPNGVCFAKDGVLMSPKSIGFYLFPAPRRITKTLRSWPKP